MINIKYGILTLMDMLLVTQGGKPPAMPFNLAGQSLVILIVTELLDSLSLIPMEMA